MDASKVECTHVITISQKQEERWQHGEKRTDIRILYDAPRIFFSTQTITDAKCL